MSVNGLDGKSRVGYGAIKNAGRSISSERNGWALLVLAIIMASSLVQLYPQPNLPKIEPVWGRVPVLGYFVLTASLKGALMEGAALNPLQYQTVRRVAEAEVAQLRALEAETHPIIRNDLLTLEEKRSLIAGMGYNERVDQILHASKLRLAAELNPLTYQRLENWIEHRWLLERKLHGKPLKGQTPRSFEVYATRYDANGAYYVALPDQCVKFTNGGSHICDKYGYQVGKAYEVIVSYKKSTGARVGEAGPWNVDDTYWAAFGDPTPRRMFADLPLGMPEAQAAYFNGYNGGLDQYGRKVTGPYGIDLARQVSIDIGLKPGNNDWVTVSFMWTAGWGAGSPGGGAGVPAATPVNIQPLQTAAPREDGSVVHEVQYGETLWTIAEAYGITLNQLLNLNGLTKEAVILPGDELVVRAASTVVEPSQIAVSMDANPKPTSTATRRPRNTSTPLANLSSITAQATIPLTPDLGWESENEDPPLEVLLALIAGVIVMGLLLVLVGGMLNRRAT